MATTTGLITVAEFETIPNPPGGKYELRNGELIVLAYPSMTHQEIQMAIAFALKPRIGTHGHIGVELGFKPTPKYNEWAADVGFVERGRWQAMLKSECFPWVPDLVAEVMSPSNTELEMNEREAACLANGCRQFWIVDPKLKIVKVSTPDRRTITYTGLDEVDLTAFGGGMLPLAEIFPEPAGS